MDYNILQMSLKGVETSQDLCSVWYTGLFLF